MNLANFHICEKKSWGLSGLVIYDVQIRNGFFLPLKQKNLLPIMEDIGRILSWYDKF